MNSWPPVPAPSRYDEVDVYKPITLSPLMPLPSTYCRPELQFGRFMTPSTQPRSDFKTNQPMAKESGHFFEGREPSSVHPVSVKADFKPFPNRYPLDPTQTGWLFECSCYNILILCIPKAPMWNYFAKGNVGRHSVAMFYI
jgi:hypothetical protein